jgi:tripartite-type tricarboxylate transporter receptor subunit TctC
MAILRFCVKSLTLICLIWQFAANSWAQSYPVKAVRYLVADSAGGNSDALARIIAGGLTQTFGQQVVVDNRSGAGGNIGAEIAAKAPADGYTLFHVATTHAVNVSLYRNLPYNLLRDFAPVTRVAVAPAVVVAHPSSPVKSIGDLVKLAKAKPGAIKYSSAGIGTSTFFGGELFKELAGVDLLHVPYRGGGEALTAVIAGETSVYFAPLGAALPQIRQGKLRALAVPSTERLPLLPETPTVAESGYPGYEGGNWSHGLAVPAKTAKEIVSAIHKAAVSVVNNSAARKRLTDLGFIVIGDQPNEFAAHIKSEVEKFEKIVRKLGMAAN